MERKSVLEIVGGEFDASGSSVMTWKWYEKINLTKLKIDFYCLTQPRDYYVRFIEKNDGKCYTRKKNKNKFLRDAVWVKSLRDIVRNNRYDCIHIHISNARVVLMVYLTCRKYTPNIITHSHNTGTDGSFLNNLLHNFCKYLLSYSEMTRVACSEDAARWLFPSRVIKQQQYVVIKYGIDAQRFVYNKIIRNQIREELNLKDRFVIGNVGRFVYQKNHSFLIDIFQQVHQKCPDAVLFLIGDKDSREDLTIDIKNKVESLHLSNDVFFYGNTTRVNELYQAMDCFVMPSRYEGLGIVLIEAQAAGLKTLCSDTIPQEAKATGLIKYMSLNSSPEKWAEEILSYNNHYKRENSSRQIENAGYSIDNSAKQIENLYLSLTEKQTRESGGGY